MALTFLVVRAGLVAGPLEFDLERLWEALLEEALLLVVVEPLREFIMLDQ